MMANMRLLVSGILSAAVLLCAGCGGSTLRQPQAPPGPHVRILTYNVNYGLEPPAGARLIENADADVVCLQETTPAWELDLRARLGDRYPHMLFQHEPAAGGMAILSRQPISQLFYDRAPGAWFHGWAISIETAIGPIQFLNVHLRPQLNDRGRTSVGALMYTPGLRRREIEHLHSKLRPEAPSVVLGDFNEGDGSDALRYLVERGYTDALGEFDRETNTWRWQAGVFYLQGRFDHIVYSNALHCFDARVLPDGPSDHFPVLANLGIQAGASTQKESRND